MQTGNDFAAGRRALIVGDDEAALRFFQSVAESDPNFVYATGSSPRQSIWSYVGRAQYLNDQFPQVWNGRFPGVETRISPGFI